MPEELRPFVYVEHDVCVVNASKRETEKVTIELFPYANGKIQPVFKFTEKSKILLDQFDYAYNLMIDDSDISILNKINKAEEISYLELHEGIHTGNSREILFSKDCEEDECKNLFYGASAGDKIDNYYSTTSGWKVRYNKRVIDKDSGNYASLRDERIFRYPKIYITRTGNPFKAFYDKETYASNNFFSLQFKNLKENTEKNLKIVLPFILSTLCQYFIRRFAAPRLGNTFVETKIFHLLKFRIPKLKDANKMQILKLVDEILKKKKANHSLPRQSGDTTSLEKEIDVLVYHLYELTYDEVKIIDKDFWLVSRSIQKR